jgi:predicted nucleic acid-binding protein
VIVAVLRKQETTHKLCKALLEQIKNGRYVAVEPYTVLVEVVAAVKRRTNSETLANQVKHLGTLYFLELESERARDAADIAQKTGVRGMDAIVAQIAKEFEATLVSLDEDMRARLS